MVALAAVVAVVPAFGQLAQAQAVPIPQGDLLCDDDLGAIEGEGVPGLLLGAWKAAKWIVSVLVMAEAVVHRGCDKTIQLAGQAAAKIGDLTMRGVTLTAVKATEHPLVRDTLLGVGFGVAGSVVHAEIKNQPLTLTDVAIGVVTGGVFGAASRGIGRGLEELAKRWR